MNPPCIDKFNSFSFLSPVLLNPACLEALPALFANPSSHTRLRIEGLVLTAASIDEIVRTFPELRKLSITNSLILDGAALQNVSHLTKLTTLALSNCRLTRDALGAVAHCKKLTHLDVSRNKELEDRDLMPLTRLPELQKLVLSGCVNLSLYGCREVARRTYTRVIHAHQISATYSLPERNDGPLWKNLISSIDYFKSNWQTITEETNQYPIYAAQCVESLSFAPLDQFSDTEHEKIIQAYFLASSIVQLNREYKWLSCNPNNLEVARLGPLFDAYQTLTKALKLTPQEKVYHPVSKPLFNLICRLEEAHNKSALVSIIKKALQFSNVYHGMRFMEFVNTARLFETTLATHTDAFYQKRKLPELARSIQFEPIGNHSFIHLKQRNLQLVGMGFYKKVSLSILYNTSPPELAVQAVSHPISRKLQPTIFREFEQEARIFTLFKESPVIAKTYSVRTLSAPYQKTIFCFIQKFYNGGTLEALVANNRLTLLQKIDIAKDLIEALKTIHDKKVCHNDIHKAQMLVEFLPLANPTTPLPTKAKAVITDFGKAFFPEENPEKCIHKSPWPEKLAELGNSEGEDEPEEVDTPVRLKKEVAQEPTKNRPIGFYEYRNEVGELASDLFELFFNKKMLHTTFKSQEERHRMEDTIHPDGLIPVTEAIRFLLLKMMAWPAHKGISLDTALKAFQKLARST